jgi:predicted MFS family arabinose efflux permease
MLLPASLIAGALWQWRGPLPAFGLGALLALVAALGLWLFVPEPRPANGRDALSGAH